MSARDELRDALGIDSDRISREEFDQYLNAYDHTLAEKIRKQTARRNLIRPEFEQAWEAGLHRGADVITPRDDYGAGPVRPGEESEA